MGYLGVLWSDSYAQPGNYDSASPFKPLLNGFSTTSSLASYFFGSIAASDLLGVFFIGEAFATLLTRFVAALIYASTSTTSFFFFFMVVPSLSLGFSLSGTSKSKSFSSSHSCDSYFFGSVLGGVSTTEFLLLHVKLSSSPSTSSIILGMRYISCYSLMKSDLTLFSDLASIWGKRHM